MISLALCVVLSAGVNEYYFSFGYTDVDDLGSISRLVSIDNVKNYTVYAYANDAQLTAFLKLEIPYTLLPHPGTLIEPEMRSQMDHSRDWDFYPTYELYLEMMYRFAANYPDLCTIVNGGQSVEGRDILFARISDNVNEDEDEPEFLYTSTMHGDETAGYVLMLRLIDHLLTNYGEDDRITNIVDNIDIWINPLANPDGTYNNGNHTVYGAQRYNANGVDLNRNFHDPEDGEHPDGNPWQPETLIMMDISAENNFIHAANFHGGAELVNYPWDTWSRRHADDAWYQMISPIQNYNFPGKR